MATGKKTGNSEFLEFLKGAPTLDEAASQETTELTGVVSRTEDGKFAITTAHGQTYEMDAAAVQQFRAVEGHGFSKIATIQITNEALKAAVLRQIKPVFKDMIKDPIKEVIGDGGKLPPIDKFPPHDKQPPIDTLAIKDIHTDPAADKFPHTETIAFKDVHKDPLSDPTGGHKPFITDPIIDKAPLKDIRKDPLSDPIKPVFDPQGTGPADVVQTNPIDQVVNPAAAMAGGPMPFAIATPHHASAEALAMQMGAPTAGYGGGQNYKPLPWEKHPWGEKIPWADTRKEMIKEPIHDTRKELIGDPKRIWEGTWDPGQISQGPLPEPWAGGGIQGFGFI